MGQHYLATKLRWNTSRKPSDHPHSVVPLLKPGRLGQLVLGWFLLWRAGTRRLKRGSRGTDAVRWWINAESHFGILT